jgi:hypothetical protein
MTRAKKQQPIPVFATEDEERTFWDTHDTDEYFQGEAPGYALVPSPEFIRRQKSPRWLKLQLDPETMARLCEAALEKGTSHHELGRKWIQERLEQEGRTVA